MRKALEAKPINLNHRIDLYVPSRCICGNMLPKSIRDRVLAEVKTKFDSWFGASAENPIKGDWRLPDGTEEKEDVSDVYSFCSKNAVEEHTENVDRLAVDIANRLTQDRVLRVIDNIKAALWPNTISGLKPKSNCACKGNSPKLTNGHPEAHSIKRAGRLSKILIIDGILRSFSSQEHAKKLFCEILNYGYASGELSFSKWPQKIGELLVRKPTILCDKNGFQIIHIQLISRALPRRAERQVIGRIYKDNPSFKGLIIASNNAQTAWELINPKKNKSSRGFILRRIKVSAEAVREATERLLAVEIADSRESLNAAELQARHDKAFERGDK